jgi:cold shock CspA family protein
MDGVFQGWHPQKPFGIIKPDDGSDAVFLFKSDAASPDILRAHTHLNFEISVSPNGKRKALNPTVINESITGNVGRGIVRRWNYNKGFGFITASNGKDVFVHASQLPNAESGYLSEGLEVEYQEKEGKKGLEALSIKVVKWHGADEPLIHFADPGRKDWLEVLAGMAEKESWNFRSSDAQDSLPILHSYIHHTFRRLQEMSDGIGYSSDDKYAATNTGLVTDNQEEIYAFFEINDKPGRQKWKLSGFKKASDWDFVDNFGSSPPPLADYFQDPSVLLYDRRCNLYINYDHVMENIDRFPKELQSQPYIARQLLTSAEGNTTKRVYRNYKAAIPQFYRDKGKSGSVQLLLPICLTNPSIADLALVAEKSETNDAYRCSTILTLDMAYKNARLLARPDSEWLKP